MAEIKIRKIVIDNFKGCKHREIDFTDDTLIKGMNASGKSTIFDAFTWMLFNKDGTGNEKFAIRPLDASGNQIDHIDISVESTMIIDGEETVIKKTQKQNWVKKRGSEDAKFQGNVNSYEVDGYPKKEAEFKSFISEIIDETVFKLITNPMGFTSLPWKEQRQILMTFVSDISDAEIAEGHEEFEILMNDLKKAPSTDDIQKKYAGQKKELSANLKEYPVRIDELEKSKVVIDVAEYELLRSDLEKKIADCESRIAAVSGDDTEKKKADADAYKAKAEMEEYERKVNADYESALSENNNKRADLEAKADRMQKDIDFYDARIKQLKENIKNKKTAKEKYTAKYKEVKARKFEKIEFDVNAEICPVCKRRLPDDDIANLHKHFEEEQKAREEKFNKDKEEELSIIVSSGKETAENIEHDEEYIRSLENEKKCRMTDIETIRADISRIAAERPQKPILDEDPNYLALKEKYAKLDAISKGESNAVTDTSSIEAERDGYKAELKECTDKIAIFNRNVEIDDRIEELRTEQIETSQKIADIEKMLFALENFMKLKMDRVSDEINRHFDKIKFVLFEKQINGGIKETCECSYNGVKYGDLNSGHKIVAGLEIIRAMQKLYDANAVIFIDNAESLNEFNIPDMDCQLVRLAVSEDKELVVG